VNTYAGYAGGSTNDFVLRDMEVMVDVAQGEDLTIGIKTGNKRNNGVRSTNDNAGWFKVDFFRIHRVGETVDIPKLQSSANNTKVYDLQGRLLSNDDSEMGLLPKGLYIVNGRKVANK
jgi:hypothetical protein